MIIMSVEVVQYDTMKMWTFMWLLHVVSGNLATHVMSFVSAVSNLMFQCTNVGWLYIRTCIYNMILSLYTLCSPLARGALQGRQTEEGLDKAASG